MKVLISEDTDRKFESIKKVVISYDNNAEIVRETNGVDTINNLINNEYDLLIQDMMMPFRRGERDRYNTGILVMNKLVSRGLMTNKIIVCSSENNYQESVERQGAKFVKYSEHDEYNWITRMKEFIKESL